MPPSPRCPGRGTAPLILVVDDYEDNRDMYSQYLQFAGLRVAEAANGKEALAKTAELMPDLIVMDLSLPGVDGWQATRLIKQDPKTRHILVLALTGHALEGASQGAKDAGCDAFLTKPCLPEDLHREIQRMLEAGERADPEPSRGDSDAASEERPREGWGEGPQGGRAGGCTRPPGREGARRARAARHRHGRVRPDAAPPATPRCGCTRRSCRARRKAASPRAPPRARAGSTCTASSRRPRPLKFGHIGLGAEPAEVHTVNYKDIAAVVSDTPIEVPDATRENVLAHERVNETSCASTPSSRCPSAPCSRRRDDIVELLRGAYDAFNDVLHKMQDKLEFGLKVLWDRDVIVREIENEDEDVRRLKNEIASQKGSTYFARMQYGRLLDAALQARSERYVSEIFEQLRDVSVASRANKPIGDKMIMNAAFLVARDKEADFDARVKSIGAKYDKLTFRYTGPWPPYNFVNIRLKLERARAAE